MEIYYEDHGKGSPILLLHGNQENRKIYDRLIGDLENQYRLIAIDTRYHGKSIKSGEVSLNQFALDVKNVADELHLKAYDVIGFSDGANIALTLAGMDERMKSMILLSPNSTPKGIKAIYRIG
ncbi:alpha/beta hydrolase, partial [Sharpea azabuensis]|uniref:alpha/beta fold hydrolase n=1 Tax=Sharpea azabuensis TaxID=322505 RepID=UPI002E814492